MNRKKINWNIILLVSLLILITSVDAITSFFLYQRYENYNRAKLHQQMTERLIKKRLEKAEKKLLVRIPFIPEKIIFCGESVPLDNPDVKERLEKALIKEMNLHGAMVLNFLRSGRYLLLIEEKISQYNLPLDIKYLPSVESDYNPLARSYKGAVGPFQFLRGTAKDYRLRVGRLVDERKDPEKSVEAALGFLKDLYEEFGSWPLAFAAYNSGQNNIRKALERQRVTSYYDLFLIEETEAYVFRIIARKLIMENPERYGFSIGEDEIYKPYLIIKKEVNIKETVRLVDLAARFGMNYREFKEINPHLIRDYLDGGTGGSRIYEIYVYKE